MHSLHNCTEQPQVTLDSPRASRTKLQLFSTHPLWEPDRMAQPQALGTSPSAQGGTNRNVCDKWPLSLPPSHPSGPLLLMPYAEFLFPKMHSLSVATLSVTH